jgi:hypothetical protein
MKYIKPNSLTWWTGAISIAAGVVVAAAGSLNALTPLGVFIDALTGGISPSAMITYGLTVVGIRGAL